jgi:predicted amidohydrolase
MKLALAAFGVTPPRDLPAFLTRIERLAAEAALGGAALLALPEYTAMVLAGATIKTPDAALELACAVEQAEALVTALSAIAQRHQLHLLGGTLLMRDPDGKCRNRAPLIAPSGALAWQDKQQMTRFEAEEWGLSGGQPPKVFATALGLIGISICYDSEFPLHVRAQATAGAKLILMPACTADAAGFNRVRFSARARAIENQCYTAPIPLVGQAPWSASIDSNIGHSAVFTPCDTGFPPDGVLAASPLNEPGLTFATLDFAAIETVRASGTVLNHRDWSVAIPPAPIVELT